MQNWKSAFSLLLIGAMIWGVMQSFAPAKIERSKVIKKDFDAKSAVAVEHQYGPLTVKKSSDGRIHLEAEMLLTGSDDESIEDVLGRFDVEANETSDELRIETNLGIQGCNTINNNMTIKYQDGHKVKGINEMTVKMTLYVPNTEKLSLSNKYDRIELADDYNGALNVELYSGDLLTANLGGSINLEMKYSKGKLGNIGKANLEIYDSEMRIGNIEDGNVNSKYSKFTIGNVAGNLHLETYDDHWEVGNVNIKLMLEDKYSDFRFGNLDQVSLMIFDGEFTAEEVVKMDIQDSKYSEYKLEKVKELVLGNVFDDEYRIEELGSLSAGDSKYTEYHIEKLNHLFGLGKSFDDTVELENVDSDFNTINIDGKYTEMIVNIAEGARFKLDVDMKYGKVNYPESRVEILKYVERDNQTVVQANIGEKQTGAEFNILQMRGFDNTLNWQ